MMNNANLPQPLVTAEYLTTAEVAELLRRSPNTLRYWRHRGEGPPSFRVGRRVLYARADVKKFVADQRTSTLVGGGKGTAR